MPHQLAAFLLHGNFDTPNLVSFLSSLLSVSIPMSTSTVQLNPVKTATCLLRLMKMMEKGMVEGGYGENDVGRGRGGR